MGAHAASCPVALRPIIQQGDALFEVFQFIGHPAGVSSQQDVPTRGMLFARCLWAGRFADRAWQDKDLRRSQVVVCKIGGDRTQPPNCCHGRLQIQSRVVVGKSGDTLSQVTLALTGAVPLGGVGFGGAIPFPVAGVVGAPLTCAVAADLAIFRIDGELEVAALGATLLLAGRIGARGLLRVKSGWLELPVAKTATPLIHPFTVTAHSIQLPEMDSADCSPGLLIWLQRSA